MKWTILFTNKASKQVGKLNNHIFESFRLLIKDLKNNGLTPGKKWPHYSKLKTSKKEDRRHCHLNQGKPSYVCCWAIIDKKTKILEVYYVGTHEKAPY